MLKVQGIRRKYVARTFVDVFGERGSPQNPFGCRWSDCAMGRLITRAMMDVCRDCDIVLMNGGGIRTSFFLDSLQEGNITLGNILDVLPFQNTLSVILLQGRYIMDALVHALELGQGRGSFIQPGGLRYVFNADTNIPAQQRLLRVEVYNPITKTWTPIRANSFYRIATNDFLRSGGDGFVMLQRHAVNPADYGPALDELFKNYLKKMKVLTKNNVIVQEEFNKCLEVTDFIEGYEHCYILNSGDTVDLRACPTDRNWCLENSIGEVFDGLVINGSECGSCSGLGVCRDQACSCRSPFVGPFVGLNVVTGSSCNAIADVYFPSRLSVYFSSTLTSTVLLLLIFVSAYYIKFRKHPIITSSSPLLLHIISFGGAIGCVGCFLLIRTTQLVSKKRKFPQISGHEPIVEEDNRVLIGEVYGDIISLCKMLE